MPKFIVILRGSNSCFLENMCLKCKLINYKSLHLDWGAYFYEDFITSTNTDVGKTYVTKHLYHALKTRGHRVCIFKPFQTEERQDGRFQI